MDNREKELIMKVLQSNVQLKRLYEKHVVMKERLDSFKGRAYLTMEEQMEAKLLKKKKLLTKDRMMDLIAEYR